MTQQARALRQEQVSMPAPVQSLLLEPAPLSLRVQALSLETVLEQRPAELARELESEQATVLARRTQSPGVWRKGRW
ncbi:MAG: hypothetical protein ACRD2I_05495 [Vicinamibacterales bacterium]